MVTSPESSTVSSAPVSSWMPRIVLPFGPMRSPIFSGLIIIVTMRGAYGDRSARGVASAFSISPRMCRRPSRAWASASFMIERSSPSILMSIWMDVMPCCGAGHLEVHVAEVVLGAEDVGEDRVLLAFLDQPHRHAGHGGAHRHAGVEQGQRAAADRRHGRRAVGLEHVRHDANRVRELFERRAARPAARARPGCRGRSRGATCRAWAALHRSRTAGSCSAA